MGVGGLAIIAGAAVGGVALGRTRDADDAEFVDDALDLRKEAKTQAVAADALYITGGVVAAVGLILVLSTLSRKRSAASAGRRTSSRMVVSPTVGRSDVRLTLRGRF